MAVPAKAISHAVSVTRGFKLVAIGCSTGGPQALFEIAPTIPADFPAGIVIVQHMPKKLRNPLRESTQLALFLSGCGKRWTVMRSSRDRCWWHKAGGSFGW
ncbi:MAG: chemotaxis protein CheB [Nitrospiraceae bacterium]